MAYMLKHQTTQLLESYSCIIYPFVYLWTNSPPNSPTILPTTHRCRALPPSLLPPSPGRELSAPQDSAQTCSCAAEASFCLLFPISSWTLVPLSSTQVYLVPEVPTLTQPSSHPTCLPSAQIALPAPPRSVAPGKVSLLGLLVLHLQLLFLQWLPWFTHWVVRSSTVRNMPCSLSCIPQGLPLQEAFQIFFMYIIIMYEWVNEWIDLINDCLMMNRLRWIEKKTFKRRSHVFLCSSTFYSHLQ